MCEPKNEHDRHITGLAQEAMAERGVEITVENETETKEMFLAQFFLISSSAVTSNYLEVNQSCGAFLITVKALSNVSGRF